MFLNTFYLRHCVYTHMCMCSMLILFLFQHLILMFKANSLHEFSSFVVESIKTTTVGIEWKMIPLTLKINGKLLRQLFDKILASSTAYRFWMFNELERESDLEQKDFANSFQFPARSGVISFAIWISIYQVGSSKRWILFDQANFPLHSFKMIPLKWDCVKLSDKILALLSLALFLLLERAWSNELFRCVISLNMIDCLSSLIDFSIIEICWALSVSSFMKILIEDEILK